MRELRNEPHQKFKKNDLAKLRPNLDRATLGALAPQFVPDIAYRVFHFERHDDEGGDAVWLGPADMSPRDVEEFMPEMATELRQEKYKAVLPIAVRHLRKVFD